jgi:hypothetical protein
MKYKLKVQINHKLLMGNERGTTVIKEKNPLRVESMAFNLFVFMI